MTTADLHGRAAVVLRTSAEAVAYVRALGGRWVDELWLDPATGRDRLQSNDLPLRKPA